MPSPHVSGGVNVHCDALYSIGARGSREQRGVGEQIGGATNVIYSK